MIMKSVIENPLLLMDYMLLKEVKMNPAKHTSSSVYEHTEKAVTRVRELAAENSCSEEETAFLVNLAYLHDIGKLIGKPHQKHSVELMKKYGITDQALINLVYNHDVSLSCHTSFKQGHAPRDKAWTDLACSVNIFHLCLFMIADRCDAPGGFKNNEPTIWFINELQARKLLTKKLSVGGKDI